MMPRVSPAHKHRTKLAYARLWREKNRERLRTYNREYQRQRRRHV